MWGRQEAGKVGRGEGDERVDKARKDAETFWKKLEEMKRDRNELQKRLEQKVQQGQVSYITSPQTGVSILCYISSVYYCIF